MSGKIECPRCMQQVTVTFTRRDNARIHGHKCRHGMQCRYLHGTENVQCDECAKLEFHYEPADTSVGIMSESFSASRAFSAWWVELHEYGATQDTCKFQWVYDGDECERPSGDEVPEADRLERFLFERVEAFYAAQDRGDADAEAAFLEAERLTDSAVADAHADDGND